MAYTLDYSLSLGAGQAGLTLAAQLVDTAGSNTGSAVTTGFVEIGGGNYLWHYAAFPDGHRGGVKFYEDGVPATILAFAAINPEEAERVDAAVSTRATPAQVNTEVDTALADYDGPTHAELTSEINDVQADIDALAGTSITVNNVVNGNTVTVYVADTWSFTLPSLGSLTAYEAVALVVKRSENDSDNDAILYVRSDTGLVRINQAAGTAGDGSLTVGSGEITVGVAMSATAGVTLTGGFKWWVKGLDTSAAPDEGTTIATGIFEVKAAGLRAIV